MDESKQSIATDNTIMDLGKSSQSFYNPIVQFIQQMFMDGLKKKWIKEFGELNDDNERNGYFVAGFVEDYLDEFLKPKTKP